MDAVRNMLDWLQSNGGHLHPSAALRIDPIMGPSLYATTPIPPNEALIACPADLVITPTIATAAICELLNVKPEDLVWSSGSSSTGETWNERMKICVYICLHWIYMQDRNISPMELPTVLKHWPYIASLPHPDSLLTPLRLSEDEMELLRGTNLHGGTRDREKEWKDELVSIPSNVDLKGMTWDRYLAAATYLSSRAFPSSLISDSSTQVAPGDPRSADAGAQKEVSHPVMIPGLDLLNHDAEAPVLWRSCQQPSLPSSTQQSGVSIESAAAVKAGEQIWNNYGPRSNEELLLGYGFVVPDNPHDTVILKLGSSSVPADKQRILELAKLDAGKRYFLRRDGVIDGELLQVLRILLSDDAHSAADHDHERDDDDEDEHAQMEKEQRAIELELDVLGMLGGMLDDKLAKLDVEVDVEGARPTVREMCRIYRQGQRVILETTMDGLSGRIDGLEKMLDSGMTCSCCT